MTTLDLTQPPFNAPLDGVPAERARDLLAEGMQRAGYLEDPAPPAALRWIDTFLAAFGANVHVVADALPFVRALRAESVALPALELERLRNRQVLFFLDSVGQYVDAQPELRDLPLSADIPEIAKEFGLDASDALGAVRMVLTAEKTGPPLELLFPLLGHDRVLLRIGALNSHLLHGRGLEPIRYGPDGSPFEPLSGKKPGA
jgi:Anticodon binding domain